MGKVMKRAKTNYDRILVGCIAKQFFTDKSIKIEYEVAVDWAELHNLAKRANKNRSAVAKLGPFKVIVVGSTNLPLEPLERTRNV